VCVCVCVLDAIALEAANRDSQKFVVYVQLVYLDDPFSHSSQDLHTAAKVQFTLFVNVFCVSPIAL